MWVDFISISRQVNLRILRYPTQGVIFRAVHLERGLVGPGGNRIAHRESGQEVLRQDDQLAIFAGEGYSGGDVAAQPLQRLPRLRLHIAFDVALPQVFESVAALRRAGLAPRSGDGTPIDEPVVLSWMPAASVYFDDPDGHSLEFICMLDETPRPDLGFVPWSQWRRQA